jgi:hypothetical protein
MDDELLKTRGINMASQPSPRFDALLEAEKLLLDSVKYKEDAIWATMCQMNVIRNVTWQSHGNACSEQCDCKSKPMTCTGECSGCNLAVACDAKDPPPPPPKELPCTCDSPALPEVGCQYHDDLAEKKAAKRSSY